MRLKLSSAPLTHFNFTAWPFKWKIMIGPLIWYQICNCNHHNFEEILNFQFLKSPPIPGFALQYHFSSKMHHQVEWFWVGDWSWAVVVSGRVLSWLLVFTGKYMDSQPIFPRFGKQLSAVLLALGSDLILDPVWTLKQTNGKIFWTLHGSKSKLPPPWL